MNRFNTSNWLFALALTLPVIAFFLGYLLNHSPELIPTGFIQYDNVSYLAYARQYLDAGHLHFLYSNPFNEQPGPAIYFQPQTLLFALLLYIGIPAESILIFFTIISSIVCFRILIALYDYLLPGSRYRKLNIWLFAWGGGLLTLAGAAAHFYLNNDKSFFQNLFIIDPEFGWWGLNWGRSILFSCEAYYHALFLGIILCILKKKWIMCLGLMAIISLSHPFTGIEILAIVSAWSLFEFFLRKKEVPFWFATGSFLLLCFHIYYYLFYLNSFPDHKMVSEQYALNWRLGFYRMIPAYILTGMLAFVSIYISSFKTFFASRSNRLFLAWFLIAFLLANHEIFMKARQPIHFTRGYIWSSLFLLGLPALNQLNHHLKNKWGNIGLAMMGLVFFFDNFFWISENIYSRAEKPSPLYINAEQKNILDLLKTETDNQTIIISKDPTIAYLSAVYTSGNPWYSHPYTTPDASRKKLIQENFFLQGKLDAGWMQHKINFIIYKKDSTLYNTLLTLPAEKIIKTNEYIIYTYRP